MILDILKNKEQYYKLGEGFKLGFDFIEKCKKEEVAVGKYELDGKNVYASVQEYDSKDDAKYEAHRKYIDIQYILSGKEIMEYCNVNDCKTKIEYNPEKDVEFFTLETETLKMKVNPDGFAIFYPEDVHRPGMKIEKNEPVKKVLIKIAL